jgi:hypothetical protein
MGMPALSEQDVKNACLQWLNSIPGVTVWKQNTGAVLSSYTSKRTGETKKRMVRFGEVGQCDTTGLIRRQTSSEALPIGIRLEFECKRPPKVPTLEQETWMQMINDRGGVAFWADGLDECVRKFKAIWIARGWQWFERWEI